MICVGLDLAHWDNVKEAIELSLALSQCAKSKPTQIILNTSYRYRL